MDAEQLWETTMDPEHRLLIRVKITDAALAEKEYQYLWVIMLILEKNG